MQTIIFSIGVLIIVIGALLMLWMRGRQSRLSGEGLKKVRRGWQRVQAEQHKSMQIMEADKVLDIALFELGYQGSLGEKLKQAGPRFSDINSIWYAHKLRNRLAHEANVDLSDDETRRALRIFGRALRELGM